MPLVPQKKKKVGTLLFADVKVIYIAPRRAGLGTKTRIWNSSISSSTSRDQMLLLLSEKYYFPIINARVQSGLTSAS